MNVYSICTADQLTWLLPVDTVNALETVSSSIVFSKIYHYLRAFVKPGRFNIGWTAICREVPNVKLVGVVYGEFRADRFEMAVPNLPRHASLLVLADICRNFTPTSGSGRLSLTSVPGAPDMWIVPSRVPVGKAM